MTIPSIKITDIGAGDAGATQGPTGPGESAASFASFLGGSATGGQNALPAPGVVPPGAAVGAETAKGEMNVPEDAAAKIAAANTQSLPANGGVNRKALGEVLVKSLPVGAKPGGSAKEKASAAEAKDAEKTVSGDATVGQVTVESPVPVMVVSPKADDIDQSQSAGQGIAGGMDGTGLIADQGVSVPQQNDVAEGVDVGSIGSSVTDGRKEPTAVAVAQTSQLPETLSSAATLVQAEQQEYAEGPDTVRSMETQPAPNTFPQKRTNAFQSAVDKSAIPTAPTATTIGSPLVADLSQGMANQHPLYASNGSFGGRSSGGTESTSPDPVNVNVKGIGAEKSEARQDSGVSHSSAISSTTQGIDTGGLSGSSTFDSTLSKQFGVATADGALPDHLPGNYIPSASERFAIERMQTAGASKALGDALQSSMGLGVQTESFGRVTIHTATEGNHLLAEVTLEDGRQSATLVSHVPGVEQKLTEQFGLKAAVSVSTESQSSNSGGLFGDSGRDAPQQRREAGDAKALKTEQSSLSSLQTGEVRVSSLWGQGSSAGRLDVTV